MINPAGEEVENQAKLNEDIMQLIAVPNAPENIVTCNGKIERKCRKFDIEKFK